MSFYIFGKVRNQKVTFVGCKRTPDIPADSILLQMVEHHAEIQWIKWSVRFGRSLENREPLEHPYARYFRNPAKLKRVLGDEDFAELSKGHNAEFLEFHENNQHLLPTMVQATLAKKAEGQSGYSVDQLLGDVRWGDTEVDRGDDRVKMNSRWSPWYSRALQMAEPKLIGFFAVRTSIADGLVWVDGKSWQKFAAEHEGEINWKDPFDELPDSDWEYLG